MTVKLFLYFGILASSFIVGNCEYNYASYIRLCRLSDPNLNDCVRQNAQYALPSIVRGDKKYNIPSLLPFKIDKITFEPGRNLKIKFSNLVISGLDQIAITSANVNPDKKTFAMSAMVPKMDIRMIYELKGHILLFPVEGSGPGHMAFDNVTFNYSMNYRNIKKNRQNYLSLTNSNLIFEPEKSQFNFENLFNGNQLLGNQINQVVNENSKVILKDFSKPITETVKLIMDNAIKNMMESEPHEDLYLP